VCSIPYAPFSKTDKLGKFADWTEGDNRDGRPGAPGNQQRYGNRRDGQLAYGSGSTNAFAYIHEQDEASFSLVDNKAAVPRRGGPGGFGRGRGGMRGNNPRGGPAGRGAGRGGAANARGGARAPMRRGWKDWDKVSLKTVTACLLLIVLHTSLHALASPPFLSTPVGGFSRRSNFLVYLSYAWKSTSLRLCKHNLTCVGFHLISR
jgi:hypothetical protein